MGRKRDRARSGSHRSTAQSKRAAQQCRPRPLQDGDRLRFPPCSLYRHCLVRSSRHMQRQAAQLFPRSLGVAKSAAGSPRGPRPWSCRWQSKHWIALSLPRLCIALRRARPPSVRPDFHRPWESVPSNSSQLRCDDLEIKKRPTQVAGLCILVEHVQRTFQNNVAHPWALLYLARATGVEYILRVRGTFQASRTASVHLPIVSPPLAVGPLIALMRPSRETAVDCAACTRQFERS